MNKAGLGKKIALVVFGIIFLLVIINFQLITYGLSQGYGQMQILMGARPVEEVMLDNEVDNLVKGKLVLVDEIRNYAMQDLGLRNSKNYTTFYDQKGEPLLWIVRACQPYKLENVEWTFPFVGTVSYKGYFDLNKAIKLRDQLKEEGYDTYIREVSAWSTLGWFKDPILSEMLKDEPGDLANTIIHELTHATIFVEDSITFNENLASFIGDKGAEEFLKNMYPDSEALTAYRNLKDDRAKYSSHFLAGAKYLDSIYSSYTQEMSPEEMKKSKEAAIRLIISRLDTINFHNTAFRDRFEDFLPNNAYFMSYLLYRSGQESLDSLYSIQYDGDLRLFISAMKKLHPN